MQFLIGGGSGTQEGAYLLEGRTVCGGASLGEQFGGTCFLNTQRLNLKQ